MIKERVAAAEIEQALTSRISSGVYRAGAALPSLRELAHELGANRNTVNKACRALQQAGILEMRPGKRAFFIGRVPAREKGADWVRKQARDLIWQAMAAGIPREQILQELSAIVAQVYNDGAVRVKFYECNLHDSQQLGAELARFVGTPVDIGLLDELDGDAERLTQQYDLIVTTFHHLAAVNRTLIQHLDKVIGVDTRPAHDALLGIARLTAQRIGLICTLGNTAHMLKHIIYSYHPECVVDVALIDHPHEVERVIHGNDHLVITHTCAEQLQALTDRAPDLVIEFQIDEQSIDYLRQRLRESRRRISEPALLFNGH